MSQENKSITNRTLAIDILKEKGEVILECNGNSMQPILKPGNAIHIKKIDPSKYQIADIVFCRIGKNLQVHKIKTIDGKRYEIENNKGWSNGWINEDNIFGLCVKVENTVRISDEELAKR